jgi:DNA invertase Pin-like site-specific DNA recombinase
MFDCIRKLVFQIIGAVAEFEKDIIRERVRAGLENARQKGKRLGRPSINNEHLRKLYYCKNEPYHSEK